MAFYSDVFAGQKFTPNAHLENDIRHFFNGLKGSNGVIEGKVSKGKFLSGNRIFVYNDSGETINEFYPVALDRNFGVGPRCNNTTFFDDNMAFYVRKAKADDKIWGITQEKLGHGDVGAVVISGITWAQVKTGGEVKGYVDINANKTLEYCDAGKAQVLWGDTQGHAIILLGGSSMDNGGFPVNDYIGQFKIVRKGDPANHLVDIVDGRYPQTGYCGYTDLPGAKSVPVVRDLKVPPGNYIEFQFNWSPSDEQYWVRFLAVDGTPTGDRSVDLGYIDSKNNIIQTYRSDNGMVFSNRYFL